MQRFIVFVSMMILKMCEDKGEDAYFGFGFVFCLFVFVKGDHTLNFSRKVKSFHKNLCKRCFCTIVMWHWHVGMFSAMDDFQDQTTQRPEQGSEIPLL